MLKLSDTSVPAEKTLQVLELLGARNTGISLKTLSGESGIAKATLLRILNTLLQCGYARKSREKNYYPCFKLEKTSTLPAGYAPLLEQAVAELVETTGQSAEIITVSGQYIYWHYKQEPADLPVRINAKIGFKRTLYELDAPSRLYLNFIGAEKATELFDISKFYDIHYQPCDWKTAVSLFAAEIEDCIAYDVDGNGNGIRRYAAAVTDSDDNFEFIIAIAEPALPRLGTAAHYQDIVTALRRARQKLSKKLAQTHK